MTTLNNTVNTVFGEKLNPARTHRQKSDFKADRTLVRLTNNPSTVEPDHDLYVRLPTLGPNDVIEPNTARIGFDLTVTDADSVINNIARNIVERITVSIDGNTVLSINSSDILYSYIDKWDTPAHRELVSYDHGILVEGANDAEVLKHRLGIEDSTDEDKKMVAGIYKKRFYIPLDFELFSAAIPFTNGAFAAKIGYTLKFASASKVIKSTTGKTGTYAVNNIEFEFTKITSGTLASQIKSEYGSQYTIMYDRILLHRTISVNSQDQIWNLTFSSPVISLKGILLVAKKDGTQLNSDYFWNMGITKVAITIEGVNNILYDKGMTARDIYDEARRFWSGKYKSPADIDRMVKGLALSDVSAKDFYKDKYCFWLDLRTVADNFLHGTGRRLQNNSEGISLEIRRNPESTDFGAKIYAYLFMDGVLQIANNEFSVAQW